MIELERDESQDFEGTLWSDANYSHVIVQETPDTARIDGPGFYVLARHTERGPFRQLTTALSVASEEWDTEVTLAPANRLRRDIEHPDGGQFLLEYLAEYGTAGIDAQALANRVFERIEES